MILAEIHEKSDLLQAKAELPSDVGQTFSMVSWWWPRYPLKHPNGALQTHVHLLVSNGSPCRAPREPGAGKQDTARGRGGQLRALLLPSAIGFLLLGQVGSTVAVRMSYCGWIGSKTVPPLFLILSLRTLSVYIIQTIFIMKCQKYKNEKLCFEIPQVSSSPETSVGLGTDLHKKS